MPAQRRHLILLGSLFAVLCVPAPAQARDAIVTSFDGTRIVAHFYGATAAAPGAKAPTVLVGPGYGKAGNTSPTLDVSDAIGAATLRAAGYNVLTWDPRGFGDSGGTVTFDSPAFEARDVQALVDYVAAQPEALLDGPGDPRVGMSGYSYGAGIQLVSAAIEPRIDAIIPEGGWHSLVTTFFRDGAVRTGWLAIICAGGEATAVTSGLTPTAGPQIATTATQLQLACAEALATGGISAASRSWLADRGPGALVDAIRAPTLLLQGTADALFGLDEAIANHARLRRTSVPLKMLWYCGGHGTCPSPQSDPQHVRRAGLAWLARWLKRDASIDTGAGFEWVADDGVWRSAASFPLPSGGSVDAAGAGTLTLSAADSLGSGFVTYATPALLNAVDLRFAPPADAGDVAGAPRVRIAYRGTAVPSRTFLYAQVLADGGSRVAGLQATPIPVILDGAARTVQRPLESLALRVGPRSDLRLQITPGSNAYGVQRSVGTVRLQAIEASLPLAGPAPSVAAAAPRTMPRRLRISAMSRRIRGASRVVVRGRMPSRPCSGRVRFTMRAGKLRRTAVASITPVCTVRAVLRLRVLPGRTALLSARFEGNDALTPRRALSRTLRLR